MDILNIQLDSAGTDTWTCPTDKRAKVITKGISVPTMEWGTTQNHNTQSLNGPIVNGQKIQPFIRWQVYGGDGAVAADIAEQTLAFPIFFLNENERITVDAGLEEWMDTNGGHQTTIHVTAEFSVILEDI